MMTYSIYVGFHKFRENKEKLCLGNNLTGKYSNDTKKIIANLFINKCQGKDICYTKPPRHGLG